MDIHKEPHFAINLNVRGIQPSATLRINELSNQLKSEGKEIIKLGLGQSPFPVPDRVVEALREHAHEKDYLPVKGLKGLREAIADHEPDDEQPGRRVTVSVGVSAFMSGDTHMEAIMIRADNALYEAKRAGRNQVLAVEQG